MRAKIRGTFWTVLKTKVQKGWWGYCCRETKRVRVSREAHGLRELDTLIHECLHAALWDLDETAIKEIATDVANIVWRYRGGYRLPKER